MSPAIAAAGTLTQSILGQVSPPEEFLSLRDSSLNYSISTFDHETYLAGADATANYLSLSTTILSKVFEWRSLTFSGGVGYEKSGYQAQFENDADSYALGNRSDASNILLNVAWSSLNGAYFHNNRRRSFSIEHRTTRIDTSFAFNRHYYYWTNSASLLVADAFDSGGNNIEHSATANRDDYLDSLALNADIRFDTLQGELRYEVSKRIQSISYATKLLWKPNTSWELAADYLYRRSPESLNNITIDKQKQGEWKFDDGLTTGGMSLGFVHDTYRYEVFGRYYHHDSTVEAAYNAQSIADYWSSFVVSNAYIQNKAVVEAQLLGLNVGSASYPALFLASNKHRGSFRWLTMFAAGRLHMQNSFSQTLTRIPFGNLSMESDLDDEDYLVVWAQVAIAYQWRSIGIMYRIGQIMPFYDLNARSSGEVESIRAESKSDLQLPAGHQQTLTFQFSF